MATVQSGAKRQVARWLAIALVQLCVVIGLTEIGLRLLHPHVHGLRVLLYQPALETDFANARDLQELLERSMLGFRPFVPVYGFVLNSRSLRTVEYSTEKPPGTYRVLAMGDSFAFDSGGLPHGDHWPTLLERGLARRRGGPVEVLRLGVPGVGPEFSLRLWQLEGRYLDADRVVLTLFVGNDLVENPGFMGSASATDPSPSRSRTGGSITLRLVRNLRRVWRGSQSLEPFHPAAFLVGRSSGGFELPEYRALHDPEAPSFSRAAFLDIERDRMSLLHVSRRAGFERSFAQTTAVLAAFDREVRETGAALIVLLVPDEFQVRDDVARAAAQHAGTSLDDYDLGLPQRRLAEFFAERGIAYLDVLEAFRGTVEPLYQPRDTHWNRAGNELASELLLRRWNAAP